MLINNIANFCFVLIPYLHVSMERVLGDKSRAGNSSINKSMTNYEFGIDNMSNME